MRKASLHPPRKRDRERNFGVRASSRLTCEWTRSKHEFLRVRRERGRKEGRKEKGRRDTEKELGVEKDEMGGERDGRKEALTTITGT